VRLLPEYDNLLLSHADRTRVISDEHRKRYMAERGPMRGSILLDGRFRGLWRIDRKAGVATLVIEPYEGLSTTDIADITDEGARLLAFAAAGTNHDIQFLPGP
jgi:hypothetical protein